MKKYYCITLLAFIVVILLQGYNISLQYKGYINNKTDKVNSTLKIAIDEEYAYRAHKNKFSQKDGKQRVYYKQMSEEDFLKAKPKKEDIINLDEINIQDLRVRVLQKQKPMLLGYLAKIFLPPRVIPLI